MEVLPVIMHPFPYTRCSERVLIADKSTGKLLSQFAHKSLLDGEADKLLHLCGENAPFLNSVLLYLMEKGSKNQCPMEWKKFVGALASPSAVCAIFHPSEKQFDVLLSLEPGKLITSIEILRYLQLEVPIPFNLLRQLKTVPRFLPAIITLMVMKAKVPFVDCDDSLVN